MSNSLILEEIKKAIGAHGMWKMKLVTAISLGTSEADPATVKCDNLCAFGKWIYGSTIDAPTRLGKPYKVIKRLHAEFHECAARVLVLALNGNTDDASELLEGEYDERSTKLVRALNKWRGEITRMAQAA